MRDVIESIVARLAAAPYAVPAHWVDVPGAPAYPYAILWGAAAAVQRPTLANKADLSDRLAVTWVSKSALGCLDLQKVGRGALTGFTPTSATWVMDPLVLREGMGQAVVADRDVRLPNTNSHPYFAVDFFDLTGYAT